MKNRKTILLIGLGLLAGVFVASSCTANFCTEKETSRIMYEFEPGISQFYSADDDALSSLESDKIIDVSSTIKQYLNFDFEAQRPTKNSLLKQTMDAAYEGGVYLPTINYFKELDKDVFMKAFAAAGKDINNTYSTNEINETLHNFGYLKFYSSEDDSSWKAFDEEVSSLRERLGYEECPSNDFINLYRSGLNNKTNSYRSCITTIEGEYGSLYGDNGNSVYMDKTTWGFAWGRGGHIIEGLVVYPVAWLLDTLANIFAKGNMANYQNGVPQILSLLLVTVIIRLFIFLVTIKSTLSQQKMTALQPELTKIQQKYPNANTNSNEKQRMAEEQMRLYKKNGVNPLSSLLVLIVQFPIFIGVWGAMTGSAVLSSGKFLGLELSASIFDRLKLGPSADGWWTALVLIIIMSLGQFFSMKIPQWLSKARTKKVARLTKNPAEKSQNRTANIVSYVMLIMIIIMGFTLPAAMGVYWFIGALVSLIQSLIMHFVTRPKKNNR